MENKVIGLFKNIGILTVSNFASKILVFLMVPLYTSVLTTEEYGSYDLIITTINLLYPIITLNIIDSIMLFMMDKKIESMKVISIGTRYILISISVAFFIIVFLVLGDFFPDVTQWGVYIFIYYTFTVINQFLIQVAKGLEKVMTLGIAGVFGTIAMIATILIFLLVFKMGLKGFFIAAILSQIIPTAYIFIKIKFWQLIQFAGVEKKIESEMLKYSIPLIATAVGWWFNSGSDKYVITFFYGMAANGLLSVAYKIPSILNTVQAVFIQAWQMTAVKEYGEENAKIFYGRAFRVINLMMCIVASFLILLTKPLAYLLYSNDFYSAWKFVPFLLVSSVLNCASGFLGPILGGKRDSKSMALSAIYGSIINIVFNILLVNIMGPQGVTIATAIASAIIFYIRLRAVGDEIVISGYIWVVLTWILLVIESLIEINTSYWYIECLIVLLILILNEDCATDIFKRCKSIINKKGY